ncbi:ComEA family DNA-binding protein [Agaribacterium haliotis]|uniref:ComEA family DNA-binding protein n=1 Tax=Agaribacterium haliotis TaxID=2013869 RepID=UPI000BB53DAE|nr:helix-hairpin-helix domain-containing protein [Agaribacterium haliotis]
MIPIRSFVFVRFVALLLSCAACLVSPSIVHAEAEAAVVDGRVNINKANAEVLADMLDGVGEKKAQAIVAYREQHGEFLSVEQLVEVKGIGEATLAKNKAKLTL